MSIVVDFFVAFLGMVFLSAGVSLIRFGFIEFFNLIEPKQKLYVLMLAILGGIIVYSIVIHFIGWLGR